MSISLEILANIIKLDNYKYNNFNYIYSYEEVYLFSIIHMNKCKIFAKAIGII